MNTKFHEFGPSLGSKHYLDYAYVRCQIKIFHCCSIPGEWDC